MRRDDAHHVRFPEAVDRGEWENIPAVCELCKLFFCSLHDARHLTDREFVGFRQRNQKRYLIVIEPSHHHHVEFCRLVSGIHELENERQLRAAFQILLDKFSPAGPDLFRKTGIAVSGQIDEKELAIDQVVIHFASFAGLGTRAGKSFAVTELVDERGFPNVGPTEESDFLQSLLGELPEVDCSKNKFRRDDLHGLHAPDCGISVMTPGAYRCSRPVPGRRPQLRSSSWVISCVWRLLS